MKTKKIKNENSENDFFGSYLVQFDVRNLKDLKKLAVIKLLELSENEDKNIRMEAMKVLSKYLFGETCNIKELFIKPGEIISVEDILS